MSAPRLPLLFCLGLTAFSPPAAAGPEGAAGLKRLGEVLRSEQADALRLIWVSGAPENGPYRRLRIESGQAALERCAGDCQPLGAPIVLSAGERSQLLSRLRAADLPALRDSEVEATPDRQL